MNNGSINMDRDEAGIVRKPFCQLWSIHAFIRIEEQTKQVPLLFVLMSSRKKRDYKAILSKLKEILPANPAVNEVMADFESSVWRAFSSIFPDARIVGCCFHWTQAVWRKVGYIQFYS